MSETVDFVCLHLTSERARERQEALSSLKHLVESSNAVTLLCSLDFCRIACSFFKMLEIELKYSIKGEPLNGVTLTKIQNILRDGRTILKAIISLYPKISITDSLDTIMDIMIQILKNPLIESLTTDALMLLNLIVSEPQCLYNLYSGHISSLWQLCNLKLKGSNASSTNNEIAKIILSITYYCEEFNDLKLFYLMSEGIAEFLCQDESEFTDQVIRYLTRSLSIICRALGVRKPYFSRRLLNTCLSRMINSKRINVSEEMVRLLISCQPILGNSSMKFDDFLLKPTTWSRYKFEGRNPLDFLNPHDSEPYMWLKCLGIYCKNLDCDSTSPKSRLRASIDIRALHIFAALHFNPNIDRNEILKFAMKIFNKTPQPSQIWVIAAFINEPSSFYNIAYDYVSRYPLSEVSSALLLKYIGGTLTHFHDLPTKFISSELSELSISLLRDNYLSRYQDLSSSRQSKEHYESCAVIIRNFFEAIIGDTRNGASKLFSILIPSAHFLSLSIHSASFIDDIINVCSSFGSETLQSLICNKFSAQFSVEQSLLIVQYPFYLVKAILGASHSIQNNLEMVWKVDGSSEFIIWLWQLLKPLWISIEVAKKFGFTNMISMVVSHLAETATSRINEPNSPHPPQNKRVLIFNIFGDILSMLVENEVLLDKELSDLKDDCGVFLMERLNSEPFSIEDLVKIIGSLPILPLGLHAEIIKLLSSWRDRVEMHRYFELMMSVFRVASSNIVIEYAIKLISEVDIESLSHRGRATLSLVCDFVGLPITINDQVKREIDVLDIDDVIIYMRNARQGSQSSLIENNSFLDLLGSFFNKFGFPTDFPEFEEEINLFFSSSRRKNRALSYWQINGGEDDCELYWFWYLLKGNNAIQIFDISSPLLLSKLFAVIYSFTTIVEHDLSNRLISHLQNTLSQENCELLLKSQFLRIFAFIYLFGFFTNNSLFQNALDKILNMLKVSSKDLQGSCFRDILILELIEICNDDFSLVNALVSCLFELKITNISAPVAKSIKKYLDAELGQGANFKREVEQLDTLLKMLPSPVQCFECALDDEKNLTLIPLIFNCLVNEDLATIEALEGLKAMILATNNIMNSKTMLDYAAPFCFPKGLGSILQVISQSTAPLSNVSSNDWLLNLFEKYIPRDSPYQIFKNAFLASPKIASSCIPWFLVSAFEQKYITDPLSFFLKCPEQYLNCFSESIKLLFYFRKVGSFGSSSGLDVPTFKSPSPSLFNLFLMEWSGSTDRESYAVIFGGLQEYHYSNYFKSYCFDSIDDLFKERRLDIDNVLLGRISESMLLNQSWDSLDIPESFNIQNPEDQAFLQIRKGILPDIENFDKFSQFCIKSFALQGGNLDELVKNGLELWRSIRKGPEELSKIKALIVLQGASRCHRSVQLQSLSEYCKSEVLWKEGQSERALKLILQAHQKSRQLIGLNELYVLISLRAAKYSWKCKSKPSSQIRRELLEGLDLKNLPLTLCSKTFHTVAKFYDDQYRRLLSSESLQTRKKLLNSAKRELDSMNHFLQRAAPKDVNAYEKSRQQLQQQIQLDNAEIERIIADREVYALKAASNYLKALASGDKYDLTVFRLCSIWFRYRNSAQINLLMGNNMLPIHKILPLMYQLAARAEELESTDGFQEVLQKILLRALVFHPYHSLPQLLSLRSNGSGGVGSKRKLVFSGGTSERRSNAAGAIISKAKSSNSKINDIICDTEKLWLAYIEMAVIELPMDTSTKTVHPFDPKWTISKISNLSCPVPTRSIPIDPSSQYSEIITVKKFQGHYKVVGGINLPKIIECFGSDGQSYRQLVKGKDDVRQDAVMEQVFLLVNRLLSFCRDHWELGLRTYRVIPLQPLAGILEWVQNATPIGDYLIPAHERINPQDVSPRDARLIMKKEFERAGSNPQTKYKVYKEEICSKFHPVFHHFFLENTVTIRSWYEKRRTYTHSTAVSSIIGYIMGLGDRHCQNIMIDFTSGELIQIDLNMIFELGKQLRIPERVPFRLTRDMVVAMGYAGLEAGFAGAAVQVLNNLRGRMDMMLMIMEAFKYDPLYRWAIKPPKVFLDGTQMDKNTLTAATFTTINTDYDDDEADEGHKEADRALLRIREKLQGMEEGTLLSERGQVQYLIQQATNEELLSQMYPGWQPWL